MTACTTWLKWPLNGRMFSIDSTVRPRYSWQLACLTADDIACAQDCRHSKQQLYQPFSQSINFPSCSILFRMKREETNSSRIEETWTKHGQSRGCRRGLVPRIDLTVGSFFRRMVWFRKKLSTVTWVGTTTRDNPNWWDATVGQQSGMRRVWLTLLSRIDLVHRELASLICFCNKFILNCNNGDWIVITCILKRKCRKH